MHFVWISDIKLLLNVIFGLNGLQKKVGDRRKADTFASFHTKTRPVPCAVLQTKDCQTSFSPSWYGCAQHLCWNDGEIAAICIHLN
eukprot:9088663-Karenia_brevis.AAC.1